MRTPSATRLCHLVIVVVLLLMGSAHASGRLVKQVNSGKRPQQRQARVAAGVPALLARTSPAREARLTMPRQPAIELEHLTSREVISLRPDLSGGGFSRRQLGVVSNFLRCHHTNKRHQMEARLLSIIYATARHYHNAKVYVIAGYRAPKVARMKGNPKSPHKRGVACDFRVEGVPITALRDYLRQTYHHIGVGYYPRSGFIHLDVGRQNDAFWIDYSGPGERAKYSGTPEEDLRSGLADAPPLPPAPDLPVEEAL